MQGKPGENGTSAESQRLLALPNDLFWNGGPSLIADLTARTHTSDHGEYD
ncbi:hypothetical protein [Martelella soudanensis]|nr:MULTISPECIES: hypothetical protein [unclassified Martelella]